jgi:hypothetical protein
MHVSKLVEIYDAVNGFFLNYALYGTTTIAPL